MGAWGHQNFENDAALDFVDAFIEAPAIDTVRKALILVVEAGVKERYIETDEASAALAAAEIVAAILGRAAQDIPDELDASIIEAGIKADEKLLEQARMAVQQVLKQSELKELWTEAGETDEWQQVQSGLLKRLS